MPELWIDHQDAIKQAANNIIRAWHLSRSDFDDLFQIGLIHVWKTESTFDKKVYSKPNVQKHIIYNIVYRRLNQLCNRKKDRIHRFAHQIESDINLSRPKWDNPADMASYNDILDHILPEERDIVQSLVDGQSISNISLHRRLSISKLKTTLLKIRQSLQKINT